jgi:hypothetical protein
MGSDRFVDLSELSPKQRLRGSDVSPDGFSELSSNGMLEHVASHRYN